MKTIILIVFVSLLVVGCHKNEQKSQKDTHKINKIDTHKKFQKESFYGKWKTSMDITIDAKKIFQEQMPKDILEKIPKDIKIMMNMKINETEIYDKSGITNSKGIVTITYSLSGKEGYQTSIIMKLKLEISENWYLDEDKQEIVTTVIDSKITPINKIAKEILKNDPNTLNDFRIIKGEISKSKIISISKNEIEIEEVENDKDTPKEFKNLKFKLIRVK